MQLNLGRFQANGNCGYVLKPEALLSVQQEKRGDLDHGAFPPTC